MSPAYESRAVKALEMLKLIHGTDLISEQAKADYNTCHKLLIACGDDLQVAIMKWKDSGMNTSGI